MSAKRPPRRSPSITEEGREHQMVSLAIDVAESQMLAGTASSQVITHFLKLGSSRERLEQERLHRENLLLQARVEAMASAVRQEELYAEALGAMRLYSGQDPEDDEEDDTYYVD